MKMVEKKFGKRILCFSALTVILLGLLLIFVFSSWEPQEFKLVPLERTPSTAPTASHTQVGTGWSKKPSRQAVDEALKMALKNQHGTPPDFAIFFATSGSDFSAILSEARKLLGNKTKIFGGSSDERAVMTNLGFIEAAQNQSSISQNQHALSLMTVSSPDMVFGVGTASFSAYASVQAATEAALLAAIKDADKQPHDTPQVILMIISRGNEEEALEGLAAEAAKGAVILGGTTGGTKYSVMGNRGVFDNGIALAVIYTDLKMGWALEGGLEIVDSPSGIVTKVKGQAIMEIDHRPALEVYDEWLGGNLRDYIDKVQDEKKLRDLLTLSPLFRLYHAPSGQAYPIFSQIFPDSWPPGVSFKDKRMMTATKIKVGERVYLSQGTWEFLLNRISSLPKTAKLHGGISVDERPLFCFGYICGGVMGVIPEDEQQKMPLLINYGINHTPFIVNFTSGEQGLFPGKMLRHGNLLTSFLVIADRN
jgi:hypothetical protein